MMSPAVRLPFLAVLLTAGLSLRASAPAPTDAALAALGVHDIRRAVLADAPAARWEHGFLSGNGRTGAIVMGRPLHETIILNRAGLFLPSTPPRTPPAQGAILPELRKLFAEGRYQDAADRVYALSLAEGYHGTHWIDPFVPACSLVVRLPGRAAPRDYLRSTDYPTGVVGTRWTDDRGAVRQRVFVSRADDLVVLALDTPDGAPLDADFAFVQHDPSVTDTLEAPPAEAFSAMSARAEDGALAFHAAFAKAWPGSIQGCEAAARIVAVGGKTDTYGGAVHVRGAKQILVLTRVALVPDEAKRDPVALARALADVAPDFDALLARHTALHGAIYDRVRFDLGGGEADHRLPSARLFATSKIGATAPALLEKQFYASRYLILSASGDDYQPVLQGIWGGTWSPPWSSGYTHDGNLPVAIIGDLPGAMPEALRGFFAYHESHLAAYRENARALFGCRGIVIPGHSSSFGLTNHLGPRWCLNFWTAGAGWAAHTFYDYYLYTGDRAFLREHAIPFLREVALFYEDFLAGMEGPDGRVVFSPSYSPENDPANTGSQAAINATMDVAVAREVLTNLIAACELEGLEPEGVARWRFLRSKLPDYRINPDGAVAEWTTPLLEDNYAHRHISHLYELYDGLPPRLAADPRLLTAFGVALQKRTDWRRSIGGGEMAFGQAQMGAVAASLRRADLAYENVEMLANWFWFPESMMTAHNPQSLFNTDIAGGIPQLFIRMLVDIEPGEITLLPALPVQWPHGAISGIRGRGQIEVKELAWDAKSVHLTLRSAVAQTLTLRLGESTRELALPAGEETTATFDR